MSVLRTVGTIAMLLAVAVCHAAVTVYLSSSIGDDTNPGTAEKPYFTVSRALRDNPDTILLRRGDIFHRIFNIDGVNLGAYGEGDAPQLSGLKVLPRKCWERGSFSGGVWRKGGKGNVWRAHLADSDSKYSGFATGGASLLNNVGAIVDTTTGSLNGSHRVEVPDSLRADFDFWQPVETPTSATSAGNFDYVYLYHSGNPNKLRLGVTVGSTALYASNCEVRGLTIRYWGCHGIVGGSGLTVRDCVIDAIGGMVQLGYPVWTCLGNGVEFYVKSPGVEGCLVERCTISRVYDSGLTVQGSSDTGSIYARNITMRDNTLRNCCQSFEEFLRGIGDDDLFYDCVFEGNTSIDAGIDTGFRYPASRVKLCHVLGNSFSRNTGFIIRDNDFINGNLYCDGECDGRYAQSVWEDNRCTISRGQMLLIGTSGRSVRIQMPADGITATAVARYRSLTGDKTTEFTIVD